MKNTNEPEDNLDNEGRPAAQPTRATDPKGQLSKVLQIGACDNEDSVAYTAYVENKLKFKNDQPTELVINEILNQDMKPPSQVHPQPAKSVLQQDARSKVPNFGAWKIGEGDVCDTECFDTVVKVNKNNRTVTPEPSDAYPVFKKGRVKAPKFVAWEEGDNNGGGYTAYLDNTSKKNAKSVLDPASVEPQPNQYLNKKARPSAAAGTKNKVNDRHLRVGCEGSIAFVSLNLLQDMEDKNLGVNHLFIRKQAESFRKKPPNQGSEL